MESSTKRVLLVEDLEDDVLFFKFACERAGFEPVLEVKTNGEEAIAYLETVGDVTIPHLILLDMKMPKTGGLEVLAWIRKQEKFKELPVVMLTSSSNPEDISNAMRLGANSFITKTGDLDRLKGIIGAVLHYWLDINQQFLGHIRT
jgi:CheY-like chemotaxis protein